MTPVTIKLPDKWVRVAEARAAETGHPSAEEYLSAFVVDAMAMNELGPAPGIGSMEEQANVIDDEEDGVDYGAPESVKIRTVEDLDRLLAQRCNGDDAGMVEATPAFFDGLRERLRRAAVDQEGRA